MSWAAFVLKEDRAASKSSLLLFGTIPPTTAVAMIQVSTEAANLIAVSYSWRSEPGEPICSEPISAASVGS